MAILTEADLYKNYKNKNYADKVIQILKSKNLLPLYASPELSCVVGHLIGDGNLSKDVYVGDFRFYGSEGKLKYIKKKIRKIFRILPKQFYKRKGGFVLKYNNSIIARILNLIGVPRGNKVDVIFGVPNWIKNGNINIIKEFLIAICDDELSTPRKDKRGYIEPLRLKFNKNEALLAIGILFLDDIKKLFSLLGIGCSSIKINNDVHINLNKKVTRSIYFNISSKKDNLLKFAENVGFKTENEKSIRLNSLLNIVNH